MNFTPAAKKKLNSLITRDDYQAILSVFIEDGLILIYVAFTESICIIDNYGKVRWL